MFKKGNAKKAQIIEEIKSLMAKNNNGFAMIKADGLGCKEMHILRKAARTSKLSVHSYPNRVFRVALEQMNIDCSPIKDSIKNSNMFVFSENVFAAAGFVSTLPRDLKKQVSLKMVASEGQFITEKKDVDYVASIKSKKDVVISILGALNFHQLALVRTLDLAIKSKEGNNS